MIPDGMVETASFPSGLLVEDEGPSDTRPIERVRKGIGTCNLDHFPIEFLYQKHRTFQIESFNERKRGSMKSVKRTSVNFDQHDNVVLKLDDSTPPMNGL